MRQFSILRFAAAIAVALVAGMATMAIAGFAGAGSAALFYSGIAGFGLSMAASMIPGTRMKGAAFVGGLQVEVWQNHIESNLFKDNSFLLNSTDASQYVLAGKVVHIPQAGSLPTIAKNRSVTGNPTAVVQRADTDVTYALDTYTSDPTLITPSEEYETSYDKRASVIGEHEAAMNQRIADEILVTWAPSVAGSILRTTGENTDTHLSGTTGSRMRFTANDLKRAMLLLNKQNTLMTDRVCLMSADMYSQFLDSLTQTQYRDFSSVVDPQNGIVGRLWGFDIYVRSTVVNYTNAATPVVNAYGAAANVDDNDAVLCWGKSYVERAKGSIFFRQKIEDPTYYGSVYSVECRVGARKRRTGEEGIVAIVQAAGAGV